VTRVLYWEVLDCGLLSKDFWRFLRGFYRSEWGRVTCVFGGFGIGSFTVVDGLVAGD